MCHGAWVWSEENLQESVLSSIIRIPEIKLRRSGLLPFPTEPSGQVSDILLIRVFILQVCTLSLLMGVTNIQVKCCYILYVHVYNAVCYVSSFHGIHSISRAKRKSNFAENF